MRKMNPGALRAALISILGILSINASAQTIKGKVYDENDLPLAYANVMLQKADSTYISGVMTDTLGMFVLESDPQAAMIQVSFIGYESYHAPITGSDFGLIRMIPDTELLERSVVKGYLPKTVIKGDAFVTPIENSVLAEAGSANDVLSKLPGVIAKDGGYEVIGYTGDNPIVTIPSTYKSLPVLTIGRDRKNEDCFAENENIKELAGVRCDAKVSLYVDNNKMKEEFIMLSLRTATGLNTREYEKEFNENLKQHNQDDTFNGDGDGI
mgnify:CR=1 FL=1